MQYLIYLIILHYGKEILLEMCKIYLSLFI